MRNPNRIDRILNEIRIIWKQYPDLRLGQLILNAIENPALYYIEDKELVELLKQTYLKEFKKE